MTKPTPPEVARVLRDAAAKITAETWIQGENARTADGIGCPPDYPGACRFCAYGAIWLAASCSLDLTDAALREMLTDSVGLTSWNDATGRQWHEVRDALLAAADRVERGA